MFTKTIIFAFCFVGMFSLILGAMPIEFATWETAPTYQSKEAIEYYDRHNVTMYSTADSIEMEYPHVQEIDFGLPEGHKVEFWWSHLLYGTGKTFQIRHLDMKIGLWWVGHHDLYFTDEVDGERENDIRKPQLSAHWSDEYNASFFDMDCDHLRFNMFVHATNQTHNITEAWDANLLTVVYSYDVNFTSTSVNTWQVVFDLLTWQNPHLGIGGFFGSVMSFGISGVLTVTIAIAILKVAQSLIPFIKGVDE